MVSWKDVGTALRIAREARGLVLRDLAPDLEVSFSSLARMERGEQSIRLELLQEWSRRVGLRLDLALVPDSTPDTGSLTPAQRQAFGAVTRVLPGLNDRDARSLLALVSALEPE